MCLALWLALGFAASVAVAQALDPTGTVGANEPIFGDMPEGAQALRIRRSLVEEMVVADGSRDRVKKRVAAAGWDYVRNGDADAAIRKFNDLWLLDPKDAEPYWGLAAAVSWSERPERFAQAEVLFTRAWALRPDSARLASDIGFFHLMRAFDPPGRAAPDRSELGQALDWTKQAKTMDGQLAPPHVTAAIVLYHLGRHAEAWAAVDLAQAIDRNSVSAEFLQALSSASPRAGRSGAEAPHTPPGD
jgi:tetratricopeptide (TPR) repeat protein